MPKRYFISKQLTTRLLSVVGLSLLLAACSPGGLFSGDMMYAPDREISTDAEVLNSAVVALIEGDKAGQIVLTEEEFSSLLAAALVGSTDDQSVIQDVSVWFEPDTVYVKLLLREGTVPIVPGEVAWNFEGRISTEGGVLRIHLYRTGIGVIPIVSPALLDIVQSQLNTIVELLLYRESPLGVTVDSGTITIDVP